jgi:hypothetical protein
MRATICSLILAAISLPGLRAQIVSRLDAIRVASSLTKPLFVTAPPGNSGRLFIVQQNGRIRILNLATGTLNSTPFLTSLAWPPEASRVCWAWRWLLQRLSDLTLSSDLIGDIRGSKNNKSVDTPRAYQLKTALRPRTSAKIKK